ncbi:hypothetical protein RDABS01_009220 [Bienertia sinuspersici]
MTDELVEKCSSLRLEEEEKSLIDLGELEEENPKETKDQISLMLVGRLLTNRPYNVEAFKRTMMKVWAIKNGLVIKRLSTNTFAFQFFHWRDKEKILKDRPWCWENNLLLLTEITGDEQPDQVRIHHSPFWVRIYNLPFNSRSEKVVTALLTGVGEILEIDEDVLGLERYRRVRVSIDVEKPLRRFQWLKDRQGKEVQAEFKYERLPYFCFACGIIGHSEKDCTNSDDEHSETLGWGLFLRASPRRGHARDLEDVRAAVGGRRRLFVVKKEGSSEARDNLSKANEKERIAPCNVEEHYDPAMVYEEVQKGKACSVGEGVPPQERIVDTNHAKQVDPTPTTFALGVSTSPIVKEGRRWKRVERKVTAKSSQEEEQKLKKREDVLDFTLVSHSQNHICGDVMKGNEAWRFVGIYGWPASGEKHKTWELIHQLCASSPLPLLFGGDFNEILSWEEKEGGAVCHRREIEKFREVVNVCELRDMGFTGQWWTWERGRTVDTCVRERLDRFLASTSWCRLFPTARVENLLRHRSDHAPIFIRLAYAGKKTRGRSKAFKFETSWFLEDSFEPVVRKTWQNATGLLLTDKLRFVGGNLLSWSKDKFKDLPTKIKETEEALKDCATA